MLDSIGTNGIEWIEAQLEVGKGNCGPERQSGQPEIIQQVNGEARFQNLEPKLLTDTWSWEETIVIIGKEYMYFSSIC